MSEQQQITTPPDSDLQSFLVKFQRIEDRLILASLPVVIFLLILWATASAFPVMGIVVNLIISIVLLLVVCLMLLRLVEVGWHWAIKFNNDTGDGEEGLFYMFGLFGIVALLIGGVACLIDMVIHAGSAPPSRIALFVGSLLLLVLQYRSIIYRHLKQPTQNEAE